MLDRVTHRKAMREELVTIIRMLMNQPPAIKGDLPAPEPKPVIDLPPPPTPEAVVDDKAAE